MEANRGIECSVEDSRYFVKNKIPFRMKFNKDGECLSINLNRDAMEIQAYKYRKTNLKLQTIRIALSGIKILLVIGIFVYWITRG